MQIRKAVIFTDGIAVPNPGQAAIGATIKDGQGGLIASISQPIGYATNNQAEYRAIITALEKALNLGIEQVEMRSDSELVVSQINGDYRVKNAALKPLYMKVKQLAGQLTYFNIIHVPREQNREADRLAGKALK